MCRSKYNRHNDSRSPKSPEETRSSFYTHLIIYLAVNGFVIYSGSNSWQFMAIFWGISVLSHYKKAKWALGAPERTSVSVQNEEYVDDIVPPVPPANWKDRDLV